MKRFRECGEIKGHWWKTLGCMWPMSSQFRPAWEAMLQWMKEPFYYILLLHSEIKPEMLSSEGVKNRLCADMPLGFLDTNSAQEDIERVEMFSLVRRFHILVSFGEKKKKKDGILSLYATNQKGYSGCYEVEVYLPPYLHGDASVSMAWICIMCESCIDVEVYVGILGRIMSPR